MGATHVTVTVRNPADREQSWEGLFLVDTGATDSLVPRQHLEAIGLEPRGSRAYELADGSAVRFDVAGADIFHCITIQIGYCLEPSALQDPLFDYLFKAAEDGVNNFNEQDIYVDAMTQQGLNSHLAPRGRYSWQEETLVQFNRWLVRRYREHWPSNGA